MGINLRSKLKKVAIELYDKYRINRLRKNEINKISDHRRQGILEQVQLTEKQIDKVNELYFNNYGEKIRLDWHRYFTAYTGNFDENYLPELLYIPEFEHFMNVNKDYSIAIEDKNLLPLIAKSVCIRTPEILLSCCYGLYRDINYDLLTQDVFINKLSNSGKVFIKPSIDSDSGRDCFIANFVNGIDTFTNKRAEDVLSYLGNNFIIQEVISCHESIKEIYPNSVNTFRVITYRWNNKIEAMPVIMRIGRGNANIDNAHAGGIFIAVDNDGLMHKTAFTEFCDKFDEHPDTKLKFEGHKIVGVEKVIDAAKRMHQVLPQIGAYNWDFTINEDGEPVLIEANVNGGSIWLIEMPHGKGAFGEHTKDILKWIRKMKSVKIADRKKEYEKL
ncbi:sugar-transfer associated ATP-grasp domain-containing protein [uncultured Anaerococcus sp.]|uniref:sugar-transfer associated ATP-grasp domain-containing protein n=1 Tax=uncultured Anaerococcus sp. TaxID=293428 RepID=UPI00288A964B|nr:sugar-transfer associated ATP-grasp domain-containing protein [uncultured Anaerococcus sp.]